MKYVYLAIVLTCGGNDGVYDNYTWRREWGKVVADSPEQATVEARAALAATYEPRPGWLRFCGVIETDNTPEESCADKHALFPIDAYPNNEYTSGETGRSTYTVVMDWGGKLQACVMKSCFGPNDAEQTALIQASQEGYGPDDNTPALIAGTLAGKLFVHLERDDTAPGTEPWPRNIDLSNSALVE